MSERVDEHVQTVDKPGRVSKPNVDVKTGSITGALAGAALGGSAGPFGFVAGALVGGILGGIAAAGPEKPDFPAPWPERRAELHEQIVADQEEES